MYRRQFLIGVTSFGFSVSPAILLAAKNSGTVFNIVWRDINVGYSSVNLIRNGSNLIVKVDVKIDVSLLGIKFFSYSLKCQEIWENKELLSIKSEVLVGKKREYANVKRTIEGFEINGSAFSGTIKGNPATTSYFTPDFLKRNIWISTQNGKPLNVKCAKIGDEELNTPKGTITATKWAVSGDLNINLFYDNNGEWVGSKFRAGGSDTTFILHNKIGRNHKTWTQS
ncbi:MAG: DUF6134 family protein [Paracoccaceae bacterium]|nr:DUF6134 family protein [Paracoccaceae bacterium]